MFLYVAFFRLSQQNDGKHMLLKMCNRAEWGTTTVSTEKMVLKEGLANGAEGILAPGTGCNRGKRLNHCIPFKDNNSGNSHSNSQPSQ